MNKPRPFLTAACFVLFVLAFVSTNVKPSTLYCASTVLIEPESMQRLAQEVDRVLDAMRRPGEPD